jgi:hypothetical protein
VKLSETLVALEDLPGKIGDRHLGECNGQWSRMRLSMSDQGRALGKILVANVALVGPDLGVHEHVLIVVAPGNEELVAHEALDVGPVLGLVIHQLARPYERLPALLALESLHVAHKVILEFALAAELLEAEAAGEDGAFARLVDLILVVPLVGLDVLHGLAAESADLVAAHVDLIDVYDQVLLELVALAAVAAPEARLDVAVHAYVMVLEGLLALVLEVANAALEVRVRIVGLAVLVQYLLAEVLAPAEVALEGLFVDVADVHGHAALVLETLVAEWTGVAQAIEVRHAVLEPTRLAALAIRGAVGSGR